MLEINFLQVERFMAVTIGTIVYTSSKITFPPRIKPLEELCRSKIT